jgi:uncharacterized protein (TIGR02453 family)
MSGFSRQAAEFLKALEANNTRDWFEANKSTYETALKRPAAVFAQALSAELAGLTGLPHRPKIYRIYRDVRFSKDKTPYNAHLHMSFGLDMPHRAPPAWMFGLEPDRVVLGVGVFAFDGEALDPWRARIAGPDGAVLADALSRLERDGARANTPELKRVPGPYPSDHRREALLRCKGLTVFLDHSGAALAEGEGAARRCAQELNRLRAVFDWLVKPI